MASDWARSLPLVHVSLGDLPKAVTLVLPYYENPRFFERQQRAWNNWPETVRSFVRVIVVDDGSPMPIAPPSSLVACSIFRVDVDVPWNWLAARNIGAHHADAGWLLLTDMDHVVPPATMYAAVFGRHDPSVIYAFSRVEHTGADLAPHSASFLMTRDMFWRVGGYDETLSGHYGTDGDWRRRCKKVAPIHVLCETLTRFEFVSDASTERYARKLPSDAEAVRHLVAARGADWRPKTLSFPYHEVTAC